MPRPANEANTVRLNLAISPATNDRLDRLQTATDARSRLEVISRALAVYETLVSEHEGGAEIIVRKKGREQQLLLVPAGS
ncbi:unnamed protein product [Gemmataceae bacterium]|nr:unnamed protein product [Gemmataceae bacterium]VTT99056.1 unnamed protein product [Gemmataceae bacterium]